MQAMSQQGVLNFAELMQAGRKAFTAGKRKTAHDLWREAANINPYDEQVWLALLDVLEGDNDRRVCLQNIRPAGLPAKYPFDQSFECSGTADVRPSGSLDAAATGTSGRDQPQKGTLAKASAALTHQCHPAGNRRGSIRGDVRGSSQHHLVQRHYLRFTFRKTL